tara:strand:+ start:950 stop:1240 length:291 start_codon:yes stop_codon:yes gene_type:complete
MYSDRSELKKDIQFIQSILTNVDDDYKKHLICELFNQWMNHSPDSPWYLSKEDEEVANTLININQSNSKWCGEHIIFNDVGNQVKRGNGRYNLRKI